ncbi:hypothetical protein BX666DRAFT_1911536 [Dichotomocladium elegans]|nr:hypothetical protein BX666DRAFT_1911536 [Dichotomocladium elegans]
MEDQFHDALSQQGDDGIFDDETAPGHHPPPLLRRRSLNMLHSGPSLVHHPPPPLTRRHSVFDHLPPSEIIPPPPMVRGMAPPLPHVPTALAMHSPPELGDDRPGRTSNDLNGPGTLWMPASYFTSPPMVPSILPQGQQQQQQQFMPVSAGPGMGLMPPPAGPGMGMIPPPGSFGPSMNPYAMNVMGHPPMPILPSIGGVEGYGINGPPQDNDNPSPINNFREGSQPAGPPMVAGSGRIENDGIGGGESTNPGGLTSLPPNLQAAAAASEGGGGPPPPTISRGVPQPIMRSAPPIRRRSMFGNLFGGGGGGGGGSRSGLDTSMFDPNVIIPLQDALEQMSLGDSGGHNRGPMMGSGLPPSSSRSLDGALSRSNSRRISKKAQELQRFPGLWCYRPSNLMPMISSGGEGANGGGSSENIWLPFSVNNQHKLHRAIDMTNGNIPSYTINLEKEEKLPGTIYLSPRNGIAQHYRSLLSGKPEILHVRYIPSHASQFMVRPEIIGGGAEMPPLPAVRAATGGPSMASKLMSSVFGT